MTVENTLAERGARYGQFIDHAEIAQGIQEVYRKGRNWDTLDYDIRQCLVVISDKIARILNGDPYYTDNYHDIQGYAKLVEDRLKKLEVSNDTTPVITVTNYVTGTTTDNSEQLKELIQGMIQRNQKARESVVQKQTLKDDVLDHLPRMNEVGSYNVTGYDNYDWQPPRMIIRDNAIAWTNDKGQVVGRVGNWDGLETAEVSAKSKLNQFLTRN